QRVVRDLNRLHLELPALHRRDTAPEGFSWVIGDDHANSVFAFLRRHRDRVVLVVCNFTPVARHDYRIGVPRPGFWRERLNTDAEAYGGSNAGNGGGVDAQDHPSHGYAHSVSLLLP